MASLSTILLNKGTSIGVPLPPETNLELGDTFVFAPNHYVSGNKLFTWTAPASGTAVIEIWGASGSGGRMCCCGGGIPGNPGAYSKKTITVSNGSTVTGNIGQSCANPTLCYRGRSENTCICYVAATSGTVCAQGGHGGHALCQSGTSMYCCFIAQGFCFTNCGSSGCGWICNYGGPNSAVGAIATGGDINRPGGFSCTCFAQCSPNFCNYYFHTAVSPGFHSKCGSVISFSPTNDSTHRGVDYNSFMSAISALSSSPSGGQPWSSCWSGNLPCGCYDSVSCWGALPVGIPGLSGFPCSSVRDSGLRGGPGAVRIQFIGS
jgi:hypothetical protein